MFTRMVCNTHLTIDNFIRNTVRLISFYRKEYIIFTFSLWKIRVYKNFPLSFKFLLNKI
ncbi:hypothetical protein HanXRQr2_Chr10g0427031 [Helianthus annuus]|uniref:Uncharacterized protein n=1 Tax=Helianthus annuus TaxID=4232 RepID=A0A9K3N2Y0_HELAN|nr:hypothetical protein HanXRQr2_Chr10g0427031 [Helianthus annuus]